MILGTGDYRNKVLGCWMGKNIGGTLGAPFEWRRQVNDVKFYTQELGGNPLPNDDLDIQLLWLIALEEKGIEVDARTLGEYWLLYVTPHWSEYGTAKVNMRSGLMPPLSGMQNNDYKDSCGAFIRSEIWACIAPGCPRIAAKYAYEDAIIDHGNGEGVYAEVFCAALESAAFVEKDLNKLIEIGLSYIPKDCGTAGAIKCALECFHSGRTWLEARDAILAGYRGQVFFGNMHHISKEDAEKGFAKGKRGWDAPSNLGMIILGLLYGENDFEKSMCITVNCGEDTDCTGATVGSIFGIMNGIDAIPEKWIKPIGRSIKTACLNLGELGYFGDQIPKDIDNLTYRVEQIARQVILRYNLPVELSDSRETDFSDLRDSMLFDSSQGKFLYRNLNGPIYHFDFFDVMVDYKEGPMVRDGVPKRIKLRIENRYKVQEMIHIHWYLPDGWRIQPSGDGHVYVAQPFFEDHAKEIEFELQTERVRDRVIRFVVELTIRGRHTVMLVPIVLQNGNYEAQ